MDGPKMNRGELAKRVAERCWLRGQFQLRSGHSSDIYFDKYRFESDPMLLSAIAGHLLPLVPSGCEVLAGIEIGGIPIATALSLISDLPVCFVRKTLKAYGTKQAAEGLEIRGRRLVLIEHVVSTGGQIVDSARMLRDGGAVVVDVLAVLVRDARAYENLAAAGLNLSSLFTMDDVPVPVAYAFSSGFRKMLVGETPRLAIRPLVHNDAKAMERIFCDPEVMRYSDKGVQAPEFASIWIAKMLCCYPTWGFGMWAVVEKATSEVIGYAGLSRYSGRCEPNGAELGFRLALSIGVEVARPRPLTLSAIMDCVDCHCRELLPSSIPKIWPRYE